MYTTSCAAFDAAVGNEGRKLNEEEEERKEQPKYRCRCCVTVPDSEHCRGEHEAEHR